MDGAATQPESAASVTRRVQQRVGGKMAEALDVTGDLLVDVVRRLSALEGGKVPQPGPQPGPAPGFEPIQPVDEYLMRQRAFYDAVFAARGAGNYERASTLLEDMGGRFLGTPDFDEPAFSCIKGVTLLMGDNFLMAMDSFWDVAHMEDRAHPRVVDVADFNMVYLHAKVGNIEEARGYASGLVPEDQIGSIGIMPLF
jgi:hypothetical protein